MHGQNHENHLRRETHQIAQIQYSHTFLFISNRQTDTPLVWAPSEHISEKLLSRDKICSLQIYVCCALINIADCFAKNAIRDHFGCNRILFDLNRMRRLPSLGKMRELSLSNRLPSSETSSLLVQYRIAAELRRPNVPPSGTPNP